MSIPHTPGPWYPVQYANQWSIQNTPGYNGPFVDLLDEEQVGKVQAHANAHVMAAGADLLKACIETRVKLLDIFGVFGGGPEVNGLFDLLNKAITKAEGKK